MMINPGFPSAKVGPATVLKLSVLLPQHQRSDVSWVEDLPNLGDWFWKLMHSSGALCLHSPCRPSFCHSIGCLRAEYRSWSLGVHFGSSVWCFQWNIHLSSVRANPFPKNNFQKEIKKEPQYKTKPALCSLFLLPPLPSWSKDLKDWLKPCWIKSFQAYGI